mgnify:CR=1 FL=1
MHELARLAHAFVGVVAVFEAPGGAKGEALRVARDPRRVERFAQIVGSYPGERPAERSLEDGLSFRPLIHLRGEDTRVDRRGDGRDRDSEVERGADGPATGSLLAGAVEHGVEKQRIALLGIGDPEDFRGDLDQEALEFTAVPGNEGVGDLVGGYPPPPCSFECSWSNHGGWPMSSHDGGWWHMAHCRTSLRPILSKCPPA